MHLMRLNIVFLCCSGICVAKNWGCDADVFWVFDGDAGYGAIAKQVRIDWAAKGALGHFAYAFVDCFTWHRLPVLGNPKTIAVGTVEQYCPLLIHVVINVDCELLRNWNFYRLTGLHLEPLKPQLKAPFQLE